MQGADFDAPAHLQDQPVVDEVKVTLDYDLDAPLAAPVSIT